MITKDEDVNMIHSLSLLSGVDENTIQKIFENFVIQFSFAFTAKKSFHIPYIGNIFVKYLGDKITDEGKEAEVNAFYAPHDEVKRIIGQLVDINETEDYTNYDVFTLLKRNIKNDFKLKLNEEPFSK